MRLPETAHTDRPWRIHEIAAGFAVEDVWALPTAGGPDEFPRLVDLFVSLDPAKSSWVVRVLFELRWKIGALLGWDDEKTGVGSRVPSLRDRVPADLRGAPLPPAPSALPFSPLYVTEDEFAAEVANQTMHGVLHVGWVADDDVDGGYRGQMAVLVKRNGLLGAAYMAAIMPFRHVLVYPALLASFGRAWSARVEPRPAGAGAGRTRA